MWQQPSPVTEFASARGLVSASLAPMSLLFRNRDAPKGHKDRATDPRRADEAGPNFRRVQSLVPGRGAADAGSIRAWLGVSS